MPPGDDRAQRPRGAVGFAVGIRTLFDIRKQRPPPRIFFPPAQKRQRDVFVLDCRLRFFRRLGQTPLVQAAAVHRQRRIFCSGRIGISVFHRFNALTFSTCRRRKECFRGELRGRIFCGRRNRIVNKIAPKLEKFGGGRRGGRRNIFLSEGEIICIFLPKPRKSAIIILYP